MKFSARRNASPPALSFWDPPAGGALAANLFRHRLPLCPHISHQTSPTTLATESGIARSLITESGVRLAWMFYKLARLFKCGPELLFYGRFMNSISNPVFPVQCDIRVRQGDLGRNGGVSTVGMARWLEDARIRVRMSRFERLVDAGGLGPHQIIFVSQKVEQLAPVYGTHAEVQVHTGIRRIGRSSFTYEQAVLAKGEQVGRGGATVLNLGPAGPLALPEELIADLTDLSIPDSNETTENRPGAERRKRDHYVFFAPLRARIADVDINQHVNYLALTTWYDEAVATFTAAALNEDGLVPNLAPSSYRIDYIGEVTYPGDYEIGVLVSSFDADTVHYELGIFSGSTCLGIGDAVGARGVLSARSLGPGGPR